MIGKSVQRFSEKIMLKMKTYSSGFCLMITLVPTGTRS